MIRGGRERIRLLACAALLVPLGVGSKLYTGPLEGWVRDSARWSSSSSGIRRFSPR